MAWSGHPPLALLRRPEISSRPALRAPLALVGTARFPFERRAAPKRFVARLTSGFPPRPGRCRLAFALYNAGMSGSRFDRLSQIILGFYFLEAGLFLILAPWSRLWTNRVVLPSPMSLEPILASHSFRGFVAGLGVLHLVLASRELLGRRARPES